MLFCLSFFFFLRDVCIAVVFLVLRLGGFAAYLAFVKFGTPSARRSYFHADGRPFFSFLFDKTAI